MEYEIYKGDNGSLKMFVTDAEQVVFYEDYTGRESMMVSDIEYMTLGWMWGWPDSDPSEWGLTADAEKQYEWAKEHMELISKEDYIKLLKAHQGTGTGTSTRRRTSSRHDRVKKNP